MTKDGITVGDLERIIVELPDNAQVILPFDESGCGYNVLASISFTENGNVILWPDSNYLPEDAI